MEFSSISIVSVEIVFAFVRLQSFEADFCLVSYCSLVLAGGHLVLRRKPPGKDVRRVVAIGNNERGIMTNKAGNDVQFESFNERRLLYRWDRDPEVMDYRSQPERFEFLDEDGKVHHYTPDFMVWRRDRTIEIHEVTLKSRRSQKNIQRRERAAEHICRARGWRYIVHTEEDLPQGHEISNLMALSRFRPTGYANAAITQAVLSYLSGHSPAKVEDVLACVTVEPSLPRSEVRSVLCHMLWHGQVLADLCKPLFVDACLNPQTALWVV